MRTPSVTRAVLATAALIAAGGGVASASTPPSDTTGSDAALEQFEQLAASRGYTLSDPACNATPSADAVDTYTCYAITASGEPFIARTTLGSTDVIEFEIVAEPTQSLGPTRAGRHRDPGHGGEHQARRGELVRSAGLLRRRVLG